MINYNANKWKRNVGLCSLNTWYWLDITAAPHRIRTRPRSTSEVWATRLVARVLGSLLRPPVGAEIDLSTDVLAQLPVEMSISVFSGTASSSMSLFQSTVGPFSKSLSPFTCLAPSALRPLYSNVFLLMMSSYVSSGSTWFFFIGGTGWLTSSATLFLRFIW